MFKFFSSTLHHSFSHVKIIDAFRFYKGESAAFLYASQSLKRISERRATRDLHETFFFTDVFSTLHSLTKRLFFWI